MNEYHESNTNRMLTPDTIVPDPTNPQSFNRYSYVENNPINFSDPTGHCKNGRGTGTGTCQVDGGPDVSIGMWLWYDQYAPIKNAKMSDDDLALFADALYEEMGRDGSWENYTGKEIPDATAWGISGNADLPVMGPGGFSGTFGGEVVINDKSGEITFFSFSGWGGTIGAGANGLLYRSNIYDLDENAEYAGPFWIADATGSVGPLGVATGTFGVPGDVLWDPVEPNGSFVGYAPGADGSLSLSTVDYVPWVTYNRNDSSLALHFLNDLTVSADLFFGGD